MNYANRISRFINFVVDTTIIAALWIGLFHIFNEVYLSRVPVDWLHDRKFPLVLEGSFIVIYVLYYFIFETLSARTLGKILTSTKVVNLQGKKASPWSILKRSLVRLIAIEWFTYFKKEPIGWHDYFSDTLLVRK